ncbi:MAG TPA: choice-of-anchor B family protein [Rubricoccaceae bacterium]|nr:choice-of-anchor B family protein [Rubricoccaceae bacterium]
MRAAFAVVFALLALAATPRAQGLVTCQSGVADEDGNPGTSFNNFPCGSVDLYAHLPHGTFGTFYGNDIWGWTDPDSGREFALVGLLDGTAFVEVTDPVNPVYLGKLPTATESSFWRDIKTYGHYAFVVSEASEHGMQVFDLTRLLDVASPPVTFEADAHFTGPDDAPLGSAHNIAIDTESGFAYAVGSGECEGGLYIVDIRDPLNPTQAGCFGEDGYTHDTQCVVYRGPDPDYQGRQVCVSSNEDTLTLTDVTDKANPVLISRGFYPNPAYTHQGWFTEDQRYFLVDDELDEITGLTSNTRTIVFDLTDLDDPEFDFFYFSELPSSDHNLYIRGHYAYLSNYTTGLRILDLSGIDDDLVTEVAYFDTYWDTDASGTMGQWSNYPFFPSGTVVANDTDYGLFVLRPNLPTTAAEPEAPGDAGFALSAPVPNPFRSRITLRLSVARTQAVTAEVLDVAGRRVAVLHDGPVAAGAPLTLILDATALPAGLYLVRVVGEDFTATRRAALVH